MTSTKTHAKRMAELRQAMAAVPEESGPEWEATSYIAVIESALAYADSLAEQLEAERSLRESAARRAKVFEETYDATVAEHEKERAYWEAVHANNHKLVRMHWDEKNNGFEVGMQASGLTFLAAECRGILRGTPAPNYLAISFKDDLGELEVVIQKKEGKTPQQMREKAEAELKAAEEKLRAAEDWFELYGGNVRDLLGEFLKSYEATGTQSDARQRMTAARDGIVAIHAKGRATKATDTSTGGAGEGVGRCEPG